MQNYAGITEQNICFSFGFLCNESRHLFKAIAIRVLTRAPRRYSLPRVRTLAHISDIHFGRQVPAVTEAIIPDILAAKPDILVNSGDFTMRARSSQFASARDFQAALPTPHTASCERSSASLE